MVQDATGAIVAANEDAGLLLGLPFDALVGRTSMDPRWAAVGESGMPLPGREHPAMRTLASGEPIDGALLGILVPPATAGVPGHSRWIEASTTPLTDGQRIIGVVAVFVDASGSLRAQLADDRVREGYRLLAENASDVVSRTSPDGRFEWITPSIEALAGWTPDDLVGRATIDFVHPDDREALLASRRLVDRGRAVTLRDPDPDERRIVEVGHAASRSPARSDGSVVGRVASWTDIDATVRAREQLQRSELRFRTLAQNATDLVVESGGDGRITWVSPTVEQSLGLAEDILLGSTLVDLVHPDDRPVVGHALRADETDEDTALLLRLRGRDGDRWYACRPAAHLGDDEVLLALRTSTTWCGPERTRRRTVRSSARRSMPCTTRMRCCYRCTTRRTNSSISTSGW